MAPAPYTSDIKHLIKLAVSESVSVPVSCTWSSPGQLWFHARAIRFLETNLKKGRERNQWKEMMLSDACLVKNMFLGGSPLIWSEQPYFSSARKVRWDHYHVLSITWHSWWRKDSYHQTACHLRHRNNLRLRSLTPQAITPATKLFPLSLLSVLPTLQQVLRISALRNFSILLIWFSVFTLARHQLLRVAAVENRCNHISMQRP